MKNFTLRVIHVIAIAALILTQVALIGQPNPETDYLMCSGSNSTTDITGTLYDSGGPSGNYSNGENCDFLINPGCAFTITLSFNSFHLESCCDYFKVYDGTDNSGDLLLSANGSGIPDPVTALSGAMYITFTSDGSVVYPGWEAVWTSEVPTSPPIAEFTMSTTTPMFNSEVQFTDLTQNLPNSWDWDFGDGSTSTLQNPEHAYLQSGLHTVTLISDNCFSTDTVSHDLTVADPPDISVTPGFLNATIEGCNDSVILPLTISNSGAGPLEFYLSSTSDAKDPVEILGLTYGVDYYQEYQNTITAINMFFTDYTLSEINTTNPAELEAALEDKQVLLIAEQENGSSSVFAGFSPVLLDFANSGGMIIFCGTENYSCITSSGLFNTTGFYQASSTLTVIDDSHPITSGLPPSFYSTNGTFAGNIIDEDAVQLVVATPQYDIVTYREIGSGIAVFIAFDYYNFSEQTAQIMANTVEYGGNYSSGNDWFSFYPDSGIIDPGNSEIVDVKFRAEGLVNGIYEQNLLVESNDFSSPQIIVPCTFILTGSPSVCVSSNILEFGELMVGASSTQDFQVCNTGCSQLTINNMVPSNDDWTVLPTAMSIAPFEQATVTVGFQPSEIAQYDDTLFIYNNDSTKLVSLIGTGIGAPSIAISEDEIDVSIPDCEGMLDYPLTVYNNGDNPLEFEIIGGTSTIYDSTSTQYYTSIGAITFHDFMEVPQFADTLTLAVTLNGDYDSSSEYATLVIESSFAEQIEDGNIENGIDIINEYVFYGTQLEEWLADGLLEVQIQNTNEVDPYMGGTDMHRVQASCSGVNWLSFDPESGSVAIDDSVTVDIKFDAANMVSGLYESLFHIANNDPLQPSVSVPVAMDIIGAAEIDLSADCIEYGDVMAFTTVTDSIEIFNDGCAPLFINSIFNSLPEFETSISTNEIGPYSSEMLYVSFTPSDWIAFEDTVTIQNSVSTVEICLSGTGFEGPAASVTPTSMAHNLVACGDSIADYMSLSNSGGTNLEFEISYTGDKYLTDVLALTYGVDYGGEYSSTIAAIHDYFDDFNLTEINTTNPSELENALAGKDILLIAKQEYCSGTVFSDFSPVLETFVTNGGYVIICGTTRIDCTGAAGLFEFWDYFNSYETLNVLDTTHPITMGLPETIGSSTNTYASMIENSDRVVLVEHPYSYYDAVSYRNIGDGGAIFIAFDYANYTDEAAKVIANAVEFAGEGSEPDWLTVEPMNGMVEPSESIDLLVKMNSQGMQGGLHEVNIEINSNDPLNTVISVPVALDIDFNPCSGFSYDAYGCSGYVSFYDESLNDPDTWHWDFGDGQTSSEISPDHHYSSTGMYAVEMVVTNEYGSDTTIQIVEISDVYGPIPAECYPQPEYGYTYRGISNVTFADIDNNSSGSSEGFEDFTCDGYTEVVQGLTYPITVTTLSDEDVRVWIDFDNSGSFETEEMVLQSENSYTHQGEITIPVESAINTGLRMRVGSDDYYNLPEPCVDPHYGQHEDYTIMIQSNTLPPAASINYEIMDMCNGVVQFNDASGNLPTSWFWNFGDGGTSADKDPMHIYTTAGMYTVTLVAANAYGSDTTSSDVLVNSLYPEMEITGTFVEGEPMYFDCNTPGTISWQWNFGDGYSSNLQSPVHTYSDGGTYQVTLTVTNGVPCQKSIYETIEIEDIIHVTDFNSGNFIIYPNPSGGEFVIRTNQPAGDVYISVASMTGTPLYNTIIHENRTRISKRMDLRFLEKGIYLIKLYDSENSIIRKLIIN